MRVSHVLGLEELLPITKKALAIFKSEAANVSKETCGENSVSQHVALVFIEFLDG